MMETSSVVKSGLNDVIRGLVKRCWSGRKKSDRKYHGDLSIQCLLTVKGNVCIITN